MLPNKPLLYWSLQFLGWFLFVGIIGLGAYYSEDGLSNEDLAGLGVRFVMGIAITHLFRLLILHFDWYQHKILRLIPRVLLSDFVMGVLMYFIIAGFNTAIDPTFDSEQAFSGRAIFFASVAWTFIFLVWSLFYFAFHFFEKARIQEFQNLQWEASKNEIELNNLKSQLNPHFMFNSMNSIRALIDENPAQAKHAITQLSNILRNTLLMGKKKTVAIRDELAIIKDYLELESIRYEERLQVEFDIDERVQEAHIPPLMIQTIVENGIKHGISKYAKGGELLIKVSNGGNFVNISVENTGRLDQRSTSRSGIGLSNTRKRLNIMYGEEADLSITGEDGKVKTRITIPKQRVNEGHID